MIMPFKLNILQYIYILSTIEIHNDNTDSPVLHSSTYF